jgi:HEAT repeat protein
MLLVPLWSNNPKANGRGRQIPGSALSVERALAMLDTSDERNRGDIAIILAAVDALGAASDQRAVEPLIAALKNSKKLSVKEHVIDALGQLGDPRAIDPLIAKLQDRSDDFYIRKKAARALYVIYRQGRLDKEQEEKVLAHWHSWYLL